MKNLLLGLMVLFTMNVFAQSTHTVDFEPAGVGADWDWTVSENDDNPPLEFIANPVSGGINTSATVAKFTARLTGNPWALCFTSDDGEFTFDATNSTVKIMVYKTVISDVGFKVEGMSGNLQLIVANTVTDAWEELTFDFSSVEGNTYSTLVIIPDFATRTQENIVYFDNIEVPDGEVIGPLPEPTTVPPTPPHAQEDVISIYSDEYTNLPGTDFNPPWGQSTTVTVDYVAAGNNTLKYENLNYQGTQYTNQDVSGFEYLHVDFWTPNSTDLGIYLISPGAETEYVFTIVTESWVSVDIPLTDFVPPVNLEDVFQFKVEGNGTVYFDNWYFWKTPPPPGEDATLSDLQVDGTTVTGFLPAVLNYDVELPYGTTVVPTVTATTNDPNATYVINEAASLPGTTEVEVTAQDLTTMLTYSVNFTVAGPEPTTVPPTPPHDEADVISIYSDEYSNLAGTNYNPSWGQSTIVTVDYLVAGNNTLRYENLNYQGTEYTNQDVSEYEYLHVDFWTANSTDLGIYLISPGNETEFVFTIVSETWVSVDIPLSDFVPPVDLTDVFQFKVEGNGDIWFDNFYFWKTAAVGYCDASTTNEDEYITDVICGDINNLGTGWQGGVADYTDQSTTIEAGMSEDITVNNGNAWASDIVYAWVDWNMDYEFGVGTDEEFMLENVGGAGETFTGAIMPPAGTPEGDYRMRVRMTYSTAPLPCDNASYGEVEDYTITVSGGIELCVPEYSTGCTLGDGFTDFAIEEIENYDSGCEDLNGIGWSQYLELGPATLTAGQSHDLVVSSGYTGNFVSIWIDFNDDGILLEDERVLANYWIELANQLYTVQLEIPADAAPGVHYMRARTNFANFCDGPCELYSYGEAEDYMVDIQEGGTTAECEDFDALTVGGYVAGQLGGMWTTWAGTPGGADDAFVSDDYSVSPDNSFTVNDAAVDLVFQFDTDPITEGQWLYSHNMYIPSGYSGYFNIQSEPTPGVDWVIELYFDDGGTGYFAGGSTETFTYDQDQWFFIEINVDLNSGWAQVLFDGVLILEFENPLSVGGADYWGADTGGAPGAYFDDVCIGEGYEINPGNPDCEDFDALTVGGYVAEQLGGMWTTWTGTPGGADDAFVSDDYSVTPNNSFVINDPGMDLILQLADEPITSDQWLYSNNIYVPSGFSGYFNIQSEPTPGVDWVIELYFDDGGTGSFAGQSTQAFVYDQDTWILVEINFDMETGLAEVMFDGEVIVEFVNEMTIGGVDYWGSDSGGDPGAYFDDVCFTEGYEIIPVVPPGPLNLTGPDEVTTPNPITLMWEAPGGGEWIHWDAGVNNGNGIGLTDGGTFDCASHWYPGDLGPYNGLSLTTITFFANGDPDATYVLKVWTGADGTTEVYSQDVISFNVDEWNEVDLTTPVVIDASQDFWFGYEVTHGAGMFPAGTDDGPAVPYNGDMIATGGAWVSMSTDYGLDYNWNIQGWIELVDGKGANLTTKLVKPVATSTNFAANGSTGISSKFVPTANNSKDLESYNVYRSINSGAFTVIGNTAETEYTDEDVTVTGIYDYYVTAVWDPEGESNPSNTWTVDVITGIEDVLFNSTLVYPNPASEVVNIKSDFDITSIKVFNHSGQVIADELVHNKMYQFNTSQYNVGMYFFQIETTEGTISKRIIVQ